MDNHTLTPFQRLARLLRQYRSEIRYVLLYAFVSGLISLSLPLGVQSIIGLLAGGSISASWGLLVFVVIGGALFAGFLRLMQLFIMEHLQRRFFTDAALDFALRIPRLNMEAMRQEHLPELINRFFDTTSIQKGMPKLLIEGSTSIITILFSLIVLSFYHTTFVNFSLLMLFTLAIMFYFTAPSGLASSLIESKYKYKLAYWLEELGRVAATFKLAGESKYPLKKADELLEKYLKARTIHWRILAIQFVSGVAFRVIVLGGYLILGSLLVMNAELNMGQFVAAELLVLFIVDAVEKLVLLHETGYDILTSIEKLGQVTDLPIEEDKGLKVEEFSKNKAFKVCLNNVSYQFEDGTEPVLQNLNLQVEPGERIAITGYSGAGLSTLMQIFSILNRGFTGNLLINDLPTQQLNLKSMRQFTGDLSSQEDIFKGSIQDNISLGRENIDLQMVINVCTQTGLMEYIQQLPQGLDTELLPGGRNTPSSVITKILVSRAIVGSPHLLALEKPLGHLNLQDRIRLATLLTDRKKDWTLICATEDPILASMCDRVLVLKDGKFVFDGTCAELQGTDHPNYVFRYRLETV